MSPRLFAGICLLLLPSITPAADGPTVKIDLIDGTSLRGVLTDPEIRFSFDGGSAKFDSAKVSQINLSPDGGFHDSVTIHGLADPVHGRCENPAFTVESDSGVTKTAREEIKRIRAVHSGPTNWLADIVLPLLTLTAMEIVLGIDNIIFLAIVAGKLPRAQQPRARRLGLIAALGTRLLLLATLSFILGLTKPVFTLPEMPFFHELEAREISWRDIILLSGGMFLIGKSTFEIHDKLEKPGDDERAPKAGMAASFGWVLVQIAIIDIIFSLDSVVTAVGMVESLPVMVTAMIAAVGVMMLFAETISRFVTRHPTLKILALAFLILIGVLLVIEGCGQHIDKGYVYFAMAFSVGVELVNLRLRKKTDPLRLKGTELPSGLS